MNSKACSTTVAALATLALAACGERAPEEAASGATPAMPGGSQGAAEGAAQALAEHVGYGTLNAIDRAAGTANISHEAVASAGWPAMTMSFKLADPAAVPELAPGQRIEFTFTTDGGGTITGIVAAE
jgi:Cu/Ag efflux protein CusF